tara:strand:+ start:351 stop:1121 length:771 start_codon:yes stop_codon:yes gene_type:complete
MYNIYNTISDIDISNGETKRMNCPNCGGYKTFTVTNNMGSLVWNCYKASCNASGGKKVHLTADDIRNTMNDTELYVEDKFELPPYVVDRHDVYYAKRWCDSWDLDFKEHGLMYDVKEDRVVFPVLHDGKIVDAAGRSVLKRLPKWKRYGKSSLPYTYGTGKVAVVVEDCVSAAVVGSDVLVGVAVLGTSLSEGHKRYLSQFSTAIIALDPDALPKTLAFAKELRGHVNTVKVLRLTDDLKYRNPTDMTNLHNTGEK